MLRLWERTEEPLVLGDVEEDNEELITGEKAPLPGVPNLNMPSKKTVGSERSVSLRYILDIGINGYYIIIIPIDPSQIGFS